MPLVAEHHSSTLVLTLARAAIWACWVRAARGEHPQNIGARPTVFCISCAPHSFVRCTLCVHWQLVGLCCRAAATLYVLCAILCTGCQLAGTAKHAPQPQLHTVGMGALGVCIQVVPWV
jgi:hypothetical protein